MKSTQRSIDRRDFLAAGAAGAAGALGLTLGACTTKPSSAPGPRTEFRDEAPDGAPLRAGLVGCGGRGTGAALDFLAAGPSLEIAALADVFPDRLADCRRKLREVRGVEVAEERCFTGFDAFRRVLEADVDVVLLATPPHFRPEHFAACVEARKHVFMEKPVAVDPVGARAVIAASRQAEAIGLRVATGTQRHHQRDYVETWQRVQEGAIGRIVAARCAWNQGQLWYREREEGWSDMEAMIRDWVNWCWLSGDHIVEQHVHNLDVVCWFKGEHPVRALGFGGRQRRVTGDQYDFFSVDYVFRDGAHLHSLSRQINGCANDVSEMVMGTEGWTNCQNRIFKRDGSLAWEYDYGKDEEGNKRKGVPISPYVQEHIDLVTAIREATPLVEAERTAVSTLVAVMGRISAYTGQEVTFEEMMGSEMRLGPETYALGPVAIEAVVPVPGT